MIAAFEAAEDYEQERYLAEGWDTLANDADARELAMATERTP
jgi:hypothetical protein